MPKLGLCEPCQEKGVERQAAVRLDGMLTCVSCVRNAPPAPAPAFLLQEPRFLRRSATPPRYHLEAIADDPATPEVFTPVEQPAASADEGLRIRTEQLMQDDAAAQHREDVAAEAAAAIAQTLRKAAVEICAAVELEYGLQPGSLRDRTHSPVISRPRGLAMLLLHQATNASTVKIARCFSMHHTTVLYQLAESRKRLETDPAMQARVERILHTVDQRRRSTQRQKITWFRQHSQCENNLRQQMAEVTAMVGAVPALGSGAEVCA